MLAIVSAWDLWVEREDVFLIATSFSMRNYSLSMKCLRVLDRTFEKCLHRLLIVLSVSIFVSPPIPSLSLSLSLLLSPPLPTSLLLSLSLYLLPYPSLFPLCHSFPSLSPHFNNNTIQMLPDPMHSVLHYNSAVEC